MKIRALFLTVALGACGGHHGKLVADSPVTPYEKPDISEITGIDEDEAPAETPAPALEKAPAPAPAAPAKK
ncbi:MAG: hypothetical protein ABI591_03175 [Kofleriaceae bacterium]